MISPKTVSFSFTTTHLVVFSTVPVSSLFVTITEKSNSHIPAFVVPFQFPSYRPGGAVGPVTALLALGAIMACCWGAGAGAAAEVETVVSGGDIACCCGGEGAAASLGVCEGKEDASGTEVVGTTGCDGIEFAGARLAETGGAGAGVGVSGAVAATGGDAAPAK